MSFTLLTEHHLEFLSLKRGYTDSSESALVKMPHCWKSHVTAHYMQAFCLKSLSCTLFLSVNHYLSFAPDAGHWFRNKTLVSIFVHLY